MKLSENYATERKSKSEVKLKKVRKISEFFGKVSSPKNQNQHQIEEKSGKDCGKTNKVLEKVKNFSNINEKSKINQNRHLFSKGTPKKAVNLNLNATNQTGYKSKKETGNKAHPNLSPANHHPNHTNQQGLKPIIMKQLHEYFPKKTKSESKSFRPALCEDPPNNSA